MVQYSRIPDDRYFQSAYLFWHCLRPHFLSVSNKTRMGSMEIENKAVKTSFIRLEQVKARTGLSRSTLYAYIRDGRFPSPVTISDRCVAWVESEIDTWIAERIASRRPV
jgi:prophage regulatory protein